jgi:hypothetical protein
LDQSDDSPFKKDFERASAEREEAIVFLASIIPMRNKKRIQTEIKNDKNFEVKQHFFLGMRVRNALRAGDFSYLPQTLDFIWFPRLEEAVNLPKDKIILTDSIRERIRKYRARKRRPPLRPPLKLEEIENAKRQLERKHNIKLPEVDVRYCDNITHALCFLPGKYRPKGSIAEEELDDITVSKLKLEGISQRELYEIDLSKATVFMPKRCSNYPVGFYGSLWHELGHLAAWTLDLKDKSNEESFAVTYGFIGLLSEARSGKFTFRKAFAEIESRKVSALLCLDRMFSDDRPSLRWIEKYNPNLQFCGRDPDELLEELDKAITDIVTTDKEVYRILQKRILARREKPFILAFAAIAVALLIISLILYFLHVV